MKILQVSFKEFWETLATKFMRKKNVTPERHKLLQRQQPKKGHYSNSALAKMAESMTYPTERTNR